MALLAESRFSMFTSRNELPVQGPAALSIQHRVDISEKTASDGPGT